MSIDNVRKRHFFSKNAEILNENNILQPKIQSRQNNCLRFLTFSIFGIICITLVIIVLILIPSDFQPVDYGLESPMILEGVLKQNSLLLNTTKLFEGLISGPEAIVFHQNAIYTGTSNGQIVKILLNGTIEVIAKLGKEPCGEYQDEPICGRPLGLRFDKEGFLIVCDAYLGLFKINIENGEVHTLLSSIDTIVKGKKFSFLNGIDIKSDGVICFTDSSKYQRRDFIWDVMEGKGTGRLFCFDPITNKLSMVLNNLHFANGVQLSKYEDYLLVVETTRARIIRYNLHGINFGKQEIFVDNLPCFPDNIDKSSHGGYWIACVPRYNSLVIGPISFVTFPGVIDILSSKPWIRKLIWMLGIRFPSPNGVMILELSETGKILRSLMDLRGQQISHSSHVHENNGKLYIGSYKANYIGLFDLNMLE